MCDVLRKHTLYMRYPHSRQENKHQADMDTSQLRGLSNNDSQNDNRIRPSVHASVRVNIAYLCAYPCFPPPPPTREYVGPVQGIFHFVILGIAPWIVIFIFELRMRSCSGYTCDQTLCLGMRVLFCTAFLLIVCWSWSLQLSMEKRVMVIVGDNKRIVSFSTFSASVTPGSSTLMLKR